MRIFIFGKTGSGKYLFADEMARRIEFPVFRVKDLVQQGTESPPPFWTRTEICEERALALIALKKQDPLVVQDYLVRKSDVMADCIFVGIKDCLDLCGLWDPWVDRCIFIQDLADSRGSTILRLVDDGVDIIKDYMHYCRTLGLAPLDNHKYLFPTVISPKLNIEQDVEKLLISWGFLDRTVQDLEKAVDSGEETL